MLASVKRILQAIIDAPVRIADRLTSKWVKIIGHSMHPTLLDGQRVRVSRRAYRTSAPARWDIVLFEHPQREGFFETKRIIGLPDESIRMVGGRLYINGHETFESFLDGAQPRLDRIWELSTDEFIVMGDNRRRSTDSRAFGPIPRRSIHGKVILPSDGADNTPD